ncbi:MAG TPA: hypothetical protein VK550_10780, partial [Polyangiaceae bacterium]|nr:hypothetical protein [Polyangiaceae bacterium]
MVTALVGGCVGNSPDAHVDGGGGRPVQDASLDGARGGAGATGGFGGTGGNGTGIGGVGIGGMGIGGFGG